MDRIQLQVARIVTGTNNHASKHLKYLETGWDKLSERREFHRLVLFYKTLHGLAYHRFPLFIQNKGEVHPISSCVYLVFGCQLGLWGHFNPHTKEAFSVLLCVGISVTSQAQLATNTSSYFCCI